PVCRQGCRGESSKQMNDRARSKQMKVENNGSAGDERDSDANCIEKDCAAIGSLQLAGGGAKPTKCNSTKKCNSRQAKNPLGRYRTDEDMPRKILMKIVHVVEIERLAEF